MKKIKKEMVNKYVNKIDIARSKYSAVDRKHRPEKAWKNGLRYKKVKKSISTCLLSTVFDRLKKPDECS